MDARLDSFEVVWQTVNENYFDATFGGLDWQAAHDRYQAQIACAKDDEAFYALLNQMLYELGVSHIGALPPWWALERWFSPHDFGQGTLGVDVRWLQDQAVVTSVQPGTPAHRAELRPGATLHHIDGVPVAQIAKETERVPPHNARNLRRSIAAAVLRRLDGPPGTQVSVECTMDEADAVRLNLHRAPRTGGYALYDGAPPAHLQVASRILENGVGYLFLSAFQWPLADPARRAIASLQSTPAMVVDLRGNSGGDFDLIIGQFFEAPTECISVTTRVGTTEVVVQPEPNPYPGRVAILVDETSLSAAELFAAALQGTGRAMVVGERTPGWALGTQSTMLPNGALFVYPDRQYRALDGTVLEGNGVTPDIEVPLEREHLLQGVDTQLQAAIGSASAGAT